MSGFTVDPAQLRKTAQALVLVSAYLDTARTVAGQISADDFGDPGLAKATRGFVDHWRWQAEHVGKALMDASDRLSQAAAQYQEVEDAQLKAQDQVSS